MISNTWSRFINLWKVHFDKREGDENPNPSFSYRLSAEEDALERLRFTQNELNKQGASDLVVELFMSESPINILEESVNLAIALLEGGNTEVQVSG